MLSLSGRVVGIAVCMVIKCWAADIYGIEEVFSLACLMPIQDHKEEMDGIAFLAL